MRVALLGRAETAPRVTVVVARRVLAMTSAKRERAEALLEALPALSKAIGEGKFRGTSPERRYVDSTLPRTCRVPSLPAAAAVARPPPATR
jgi:hypothetical protein